MKHNHLPGTLFGFILILTPLSVLAHAGHGDEFKGSSAAVSGTGVSIDAETANRIGLQVETVKRQRLPVVLQATGKLETPPSRQVEVTNPTGGTLIKLYVQPGDRVSQGQPVALLSSPELAALRTESISKNAEAQGDIKQAEADLRLAQETLVQQQKIAETEIREAKAALAFAQERADKDRMLAEKGALPTRQALESETKLTEAQAVLTKAESRLAVTEASTQLQRAKASVEVANSRVSLSDAAYTARLKQLGATANEDGTVTVTAPIAGIVADREASVGQSAQDAGAKLLSIVDSQTVLATANIYEKDLSAVREGQAVRVTIAGLKDQTFNGRITVIGTAVNGETRVVPVKAELDNSNGQLKPGMFANLELVTDQSSANVIAIPKRAIVEIQGKPMVYVENGQRFEPVEVQTGATAGDLVEIKNGLLEGDKVVVQRAQQLYAQSLRGGSQAAESHDHPPENTPKVQSTFPWQLILSAGGATVLTAGVFWAGSLWGRRKSQQPSPKPSFQQATHHIHEFHPEHLHPRSSDVPLSPTELKPEPIAVAAEED